MRIVDSRIYTILFFAAFIGSLTILPFAMHEKASLLLQQPLRPTTLFSLQIIISIIVFGIFVYLGLYFGKKVNLGTPLLSALVNKQKISMSFTQPLLVGLLLGIFSSIFIRVFDYPATYASSIGVRLLAVLYGGITQEILLRLFVMTTIVFAFSRVFCTKKPSVYWTGILGTAFIFAFSNLPNLMQFEKLTFFLVVQSVLLNFIPDIAFGWLYWKKGLESAIIAHVVFDLFVLVLF